MNTILAMSRTSVAITVLTAFGIAGAALSRLAGPPGATPIGHRPNDVLPAIVVDLIIKDSKDPTEEGPGIYVDCQDLSDPDSRSFDDPPPASFVSGSTETLRVQGISPGTGSIVERFTPESDATTPGNDTVKVTVTKRDMDRNSRNHDQAGKGQGAGVEFKPR